MVVTVPPDHNYLASMTFGIVVPDPAAVVSVREWDGTAPIGAVLYTLFGWGTQAGDAIFTPDIEVTPGKSYLLYVHTPGLLSTYLETNGSPSGQYEALTERETGWRTPEHGIGARIDFRIRPTVASATAIPGVADVVTLNGTGFTLATAVMIDGEDAVFEFVSDTEMRVTVPAASSTLADLVVTGDDVPSVPVSLQITQPPTVDPPVTTQPADTLTESGADLDMLPLGAAALALGGLLVGLRRRT